METEPEFLPSGGITSPKGFLAGATRAGLRSGNSEWPDLGILFSQESCTTTAVFTTNKVKAAPVLLNQARIERGKAQAIVINSGYANSCTGEQGMADAIEMAELTARSLGISSEEVLVASTGLIGVLLPMERIRAGISDVKLSMDGGHDLATAILTTDTIPKEVAITSDGFTIGGMAKGAGMIHPNLATMLGFLTTDASVDACFLRQALKQAVDVSFNLVSVDGDNSTNDTVVIMANGQSGNDPIKPGSRQAEIFQQTLTDVCTYLARAIAGDGEGATKLIEVTVKGAATPADAKTAARTIVSSSLVKAAVHGSDPNWGRVVAAAGRSGVDLIPERIYLEIGGICLVRDGTPVMFYEEDVVRHLSGKSVSITLNLNMGDDTATAWGCDLTPKYVTINSDYTT